MPFDPTVVEVGFVIRPRDCPAWVRTVGNDPTLTFDRAKARRFSYDEAQSTVDFLAERVGCPIDWLIEEGGGAAMRVTIVLDLDPARVDPEYWTDWFLDLQDALPPGLSLVDVEGLDGSDPVVRTWAGS